MRVGALLSGGLDSSTIAALLASTAGRDHPTFSFGVRGAAPALDELPYAEAVARAHGLPNHQAGMDAHWVRAHAPAVIRALEEPPLALPALAQYRTFQLCREHGATVVLDGQGADEVLGGYPYHQRTLVADRLRRGRFGDAGRELRAIALRERVGRMRLLAAVALPTLRGRLRRRLPWVASPPRRGGEDVGRARADRGHDPSALNRQLYWDVRWGNVKIVLGYTDRNAMAHSVEARVPFFDRALVEFAFTLPDHFKVGDGQRKRILRDSARAFLPPEVTERPDRLGFAVPAGALMGALLPDVRAAIQDSGILSSRWLHRTPALRMLDRFAAGDAGARGGSLAALRLCAVGPGVRRCPRLRRPAARRRLVLCATGAYQSFTLPGFILSLLRHVADDVHVVLSASAARLVSPLAVEAASHHAVHMDADGADDALAEVVREADLVLVYPATVNVVGKVANGIAGDAGVGGGSLDDGAGDLRALRQPADVGPPAGGAQPGAAGGARLRRAPAAVGGRGGDARGARGVRRAVSAAHPAAAAHRRPARSIGRPRAPPGVAVGLSRGRPPGDTVEGRVEGPAEPRGVHEPREAAAPEEDAHHRLPWRPPQHRLVAVAPQRLGVVLHAREIGGHEAMVDGVAQVRDPQRVDTHERAQEPVALADAVGGDDQALAQGVPFDRPAAVQEPRPVHHGAGRGQPAVDGEDRGVEHVVVVQAQGIGDEAPLVLHGQADPGHAVDLGHRHGDERVHPVREQGGERNRFLPSRVLDGKRDRR